MTMADLGQSTRNNRILYKGEYLYEGTPKKHVDADGYTWILVSSNRTGWSGYVASDYIECNDY